MIKDLFKKNKYAVIKTTIKNESIINKVHEKIKEENIEEIEKEKPTIPEGLWVKCLDCNRIIYKDDLNINGNICPYCNKHFRLGARKRASMILDEGYVEIFRGIKTVNPLSFNGYDNKIKKVQSETGEEEAVLCFNGKINGEKTLVAIMDSYFFMGSMGSVVGEKITRIFEEGIKERLPVIVFTTSGGARMQEGIFSLMQMAKVSGAIKRFSDEGGLYITVLTDPTTGGVTASFAMEGDIILAEPGTLIGFAGRRVIENTIGESLPSDFQKAEFLLKKGFIDKIVDRKDLKTMLAKFLKLHRGV